MRGSVRERSRAAVAAAGMRERRAPVQSAGAWDPAPGKKKDGPFRPGKTKSERRRGS